VRTIPDRFTPEWWRLWRSGALARDVAFFQEAADRLERELEGSEAWYYRGEDADALRKGLPLKFPYGMGIRGLLAATAQDMWLPRDVYKACLVRLGVDEDALPGTD